MAKEITVENFEAEVLKSEKPILIDFWATWCGPCMRQGPVVEELAEEGYAVGKVDVDQNMALAQQCCEHPDTDSVQRRCRSTAFRWPYFQRRTEKCTGRLRIYEDFISGMQCQIYSFQSRGL